jgi:hypothetical protein
LCLLFRGDGFFLQFRERLIKIYAGLFNTVGEQNKKETHFNEKWGWYVSVRALAELNKVEEEKVLEYSIYKFYRLLEFEKDRAEVTKEMIKNASKK